MKTIRILITVLLFAVLLLQAVYAVPFTPSIERKDGPELVGEVGGDKLIITPISHLYNGSTLHTDIKDSLEDARDELKEGQWHEIVADFPEIWDEFTGGAPLDHAVICDIFDARFESELSSGADKGKPVTFKIKVQGLSADDLFLILTKASDEEGWKVVDYTIDENGVITISANSMSAFAIAKDNGAAPVVDPNAPQSPQTAVSEYIFVTFAVISVLVFIAAFSLKKVLKKAGN